MDEGRALITAASAAYLNHAVELTGKKLALFSSSSPLALSRLCEAQ